MFSKRISKNVFWVHSQILGRCTYTQEELNKLPIKEMEMDDIRSQIHSLADALMIFDKMQYNIVDDTILVEDNGMLWEHHPPLSQMLQKKKGNCASAAAWLVEAIKGIYDAVSMLLIFRENQTGHVINVIKYEKKFYFVDMYMHMLDNQQYLCPETGLLSDFVKQKFLTGVIYESDSLISFTSFYSRFMRNKIKEQVFVLLEMDCVPPLASEKKDDIIMLYISAENVHTVINPTNKMRCSCDKRTMRLQDWG